VVEKGFASFLFLRVLCVMALFKILLANSPKPHYTARMKTNLFSINNCKKEKIIPAIAQVGTLFALSL
jgi:hypothetical protein